MSEQLPVPGHALNYPGPLSTLLTTRAEDSAKLQVVVVTDYNESAGFGWLLYNALNCFHLCTRLGRHARPVVFFSKGYYNEQRPAYVHLHAAAVDHVWDSMNWFNNFFEPVEPADWRPFLASNFSQHVQAASASAGRNMRPGVAQFNRASLDSIGHQFRDYTALWRQFLRPRPHIQRQFEALRSQLFPADATVYAVHYRGSDKFGHSAVLDRRTGRVASFAREDDPEHVPYDWVFEKIRAAVTEGVRTGRHGLGNWILYCASDEAPFIAAARAALGTAFVAAKPGTIRSAVSTSGLEMDTSRCGVGKRGTPACDKLQELVEASVHRGHLDESSYKKGEDVLLETMLLSTACVFYRSRGNFSSLPVYMRLNDAQTVVDMVTLWKRDRADWVQRYGAVVVK